MKRVSLILIGLALGTLLLAQQPHHQKGMLMNKSGYNNSNRCNEMGFRNYRGKDDMCGMRMIDQLDLTDAQIDKINDLRKEHQTKIVELKADVGKLQIDLKEANRNTDFKKAKSINDKIYKKKGEIAKKRIELNEKIFNQLTEGQQEKITTLKKYNRAK